MALAVLLALAIGIARAQEPPEGPGPEIAQGPPQGPGPGPQQGPPPSPGPGPAQGSPSAPEQANPEAQPGVGRISLIQGNVSTQRGDSGEWVAVTPNTPLVAGDSISTAPGARAEVQLDYANVLRLSESANAKIVALAPNQIQIQVGQGLVYLSVLRPGEAAVEIQTPNAAVHPAGPGSYRIFVEPDVETRMVVRNGAADVSTPQGSTRVEKGQLIRIQGTDNPQYQIAYAPAVDDWDRWNGDRDRLIANSEGARRTTPYYVGTQDLDPYGQWVNAPDYGNVWVPAVAPGWAPYRAGRWVWEPFYGWTWVSYEPWGWAPYHYGRWFMYGGAWAWWPGPVIGAPLYRPLWSPAYVSFFGFGGGVSFGIGFGFGTVGWLPIGPGDFFFPWYGRWGGRVNVVNIYNYNGRGFNYAGLHGIGPLAGERGFSNMREAFANDRVRAGMTSIAGNQFGRSGVPIRQEGMSAASLRQGGLMTGRLGMSPTRESYRPTDRAANPASIPSRAANSQRFFSDSRSAAFRPSGPQANAGLNARTNSGANSFAGNRTTPQSGWNGFGSGNQSAMGSARPQSSPSGIRPGNSASPSFGGQGTQGAQAANNNRVQSGGPGGWQSFGSQNRATQAGPANRNLAGSNEMPSPSSNRPPLNLGHPIVTQRGPSTAPGGPGGGNRGGPAGAHGPTGPPPMRSGGGHPGGGHPSGRR